MRLGTNFARPAAIELEAAEAFVDLIDSADMVKFAKNGSDATTAAVRLARAATGRDGVIVCADQPFFSTDDWFIGHTPMPAGIPAAWRPFTIGFPYNDLDALAARFAEHPGRDRLRGPRSRHGRRAGAGLPRRRASPVRRSTARCSSSTR